MRSKRLGAATSVAVVVSAVGSLALMLREGRHSPAILIFLFTGWVLLPYVALAVGQARIMRRSERAAGIMQIATWIVSLGSLAVYGVAASLPRAPRPAAIYLLVPLVSLGAVGVAYAVGVARSRTSS